MEPSSCTGGGDRAHHLAVGIMVFTVPLQLLACAYGFLCRDVVTSPDLGVLAGTWAAIGLTPLTSRTESRWRMEQEMHFDNSCGYA